MPDYATLQELFFSDLVLIALVLVAYVSAILIIFWPALFANALHARIKDLAGTLPLPDRNGTGPAAATESRQTTPSLKTRLNRRLTRYAASSFASLKKDLHNAGLRSPRAASIFVIAKVTIPFVAMLLAWGFLNATIMAQRPPVAIILASLLCGVAAIWAPDLALKNLRLRYQEKIRRDWPDALDLIYLCVDAGLGLEAALSKVARDISTSAPELAQEFTLTVAELAFLQNRRDALENMGRRINIPAVREATRAISQAQFYGMPLSSTLRNLSEESRRMRIAAAEKKAATLPSRLRVPLILFLIPVLFIVILAPAAIDILDLQ
ncbi:type II secretion system F family protein [Nioella ostreopsis]|uniref:type II secretion system F family protein n=1 Tax=Nioella ostreopsis TaxID=2448479 RepID=UPI000FDB06A7|nr:type II secretion system F family protein [Nioella ostreopsis]